MPFFLGEFVNADGTPFPICPRQMLKSVLKRAEKLGVQPMCGMEFEWFNFAETPQSWAAKKGVDPTPLTPGMFGYSLLRANREPRILQRADGRDAAFRRADRRPAHRDRARRLRGRDPVFARRSRAPTAACCSRPAPRRSARASASCRASWPSGARSTRAAAATSTRACPTARRTCSTTPRASRRHEQAVRELPRRPGRLPDGIRADVLADHQQLQAAGRRLLGAGQADLGRSTTAPRASA